MASSKPRLIVNADDFGRSSAVNAGIIEGHEKGIITSTSLMTKRDAFDEAVTLARSHPKLGIGLHLDLDEFFKVEHGTGRLLEYQDPTMPMSAIANETESQIVKIKKTGIPMTHLDGHHHSHLRPELFATVAALAAKHGIPVIRWFGGFYEGLYPGADFSWIPDLLDRFKLKYPKTFFAGWEPVESSLPGYSYLNWSVPFETAELMVHPGKGEPWRERELELCTSPKVRQEIEKRGIELCNFSGL